MEEWRERELLVLEWTLNTFTAVRLGDWSDRVWWNLDSEEKEAIHTEVVPLRKEFRHNPCHSLHSTNSGARVRPWFPLYRCS